MTRTAVGTQIHINSLCSTRNPGSLKNSRTPIGETAMGRMGKKYLVGSNGEKNATPNPPSVNASSRPCDAADKKIWKSRVVAPVSGGLAQ